MEAFVRAATSGRRARADALWRPTDDPWARLVHGDGWDGDANEPGGPLGWAPLLYVTHSVYANVALARDLLARGADPNATFTNEYGEMSALYGARSSPPTSTGTSRRRSCWPTRCRSSSSSTARTSRA